jgi:N-acetylglutamate synthase-like GNAT family acetyltransferase
MSESQAAFESANYADMPIIVECVSRFRLDDEDLKAEQFIVLKKNDRIVAFGRIKPYGGGVYELGCVAVLEEERGQGMGKQVVHELIRRFPVPNVYITTDLPEYFEPFGFRQITDGPPEILMKIQRVCGRLRTGVVPMVLRKETAGS